MRRSTLIGEMFGEMLGSFLLVFFGTGCVAVAVLTGASQGLWQVATVWGFAIGLSIYSVGAVSGAHLNPAVTLAMATVRGSVFPWRKVGPYIGAQFVGGLLASLLLLTMFGATCKRFEADKGIVRGQPGSQLSASWFGEYFPNPGVYGTDEKAFSQVSVAGGFAGELVGTALLLFFIMALTDKCNKLAPIEGNFHPFLIGFAVAVIISIIAPLTQAGLNPMRDFAPRLVSYFAGWGSIAIPGPRGCEWWVYIVAPILGALIGALAYEKLVAPYQTGERVAAGQSRASCGLYCLPPTISMQSREGTPTVTVRVFVSNPTDPSELGASAVSRVRAAASRFKDLAVVEVLPLSGQVAADTGAAIEPTVVVDDLILSIGQVPAAGHIARAITASLERGAQ